MDSGGRESQEQIRHAPTESRANPQLVRSTVRQPGGPGMADTGERARHIGTHMDQEEGQFRGQSDNRFRGEHAEHRSGVKGRQRLGEDLSKSRLRSRGHSHALSEWQPTSRCEKQKHPAAAQDSEQQTARQSDTTACASCRG